MSLLLLLGLLALVKIVIASLMVWIPMRSDSAMSALADQSGLDEPDAGEDEGGSKTFAGSPAEPHPRLPYPHRPRRRGPHGSPSAPSPARIRKPTRRVVARSPARH
jgi:hypothetical protein